MIWEGVRGKEIQIDMFRRAVSRGRFAQGYLFVGPEGIGKRKFASLLAQSLFCERVEESQLDACGVCSACRQMVAGTHPDFLSVGRLPGKSELTIEVIAGTTERRGREGLAHELSMRPMSSSRKIAVIDDAHRMNPESANSLLKTLEEPPPFAHLFLIAASLDDILPTIRSRCQLIRFAPLSDNDVSDLLLEQNRLADRNEALAIAKLAGGSLATASLLLDPAVQKIRQTLRNLISERDYSSVPVSKTILALMEEVDEDVLDTRETGRWVARFCINLFHQALRETSPVAGTVSTTASDPVLKSLDTRLPPTPGRRIELLSEAITRAARMEQQIDQMTPVPLAVEGFFDDLGRILRSA